MHTAKERGPHIDADDKSTASLRSSRRPIERCRPPEVSSSAVFICRLRSEAPSALSLYLCIILQEAAAFKIGSD